MSADPTTAEPPNPAGDFARGLTTFEQLSAQTKALALLKDQAEKATGPEGVALAKLIRERAQ